MFENLYETAVDIERVTHSKGGDSLRLAIACKFSLGDVVPMQANRFGRQHFFRRIE